MAKTNDAIPSWSGFVYQGKVMILCVLERMRQLLSDGEALTTYMVELEKQEDFAFIKEGITESLYQVKEWNNRKHWKEYSSALQKLLDHQHDSNNPHARCYLVSSEEIKDWSDQSNKYQNLVDLYLYDNHYISGLQIIDDIKTELQLFLDKNKLSAGNIDIVYSYLCVYVEHQVLQMHQAGSQTREYRISLNEFLKVLKNALVKTDIDDEFEEKEQKYIRMWEDVMVPANEELLEMFSGLVDQNIDLWMKSRSAYQYCECIIDLFLKEKISKKTSFLEYEDLDLKGKINLVKKYYDLQMGKDLMEIVDLHNKSMKYTQKIKNVEIESVVDKLRHVIERLFIHYFSSENHIFGSELEVVSLFSLLPLKHRIYILSNIQPKPPCPHTWHHHK